MNSRKLPLGSGLRAELNEWESPVPPSLARAAHELVYSHLKEERLEAMLLGKYAGAQFVLETAHVNGALAATCWAGWGVGFPDIGGMAGVTTSGPYRGHGIARNLVTAATKRFVQAGGRLLYLGTTNPSARAIYESLGFRQVVGSAYCRASGRAALDEGFTAGGPARVRDASWRDCAAIIPLFYLPHPCVLVDSGILFPSVRLVDPWRCVRIFWEMWGGVEEGGRWRVLENSAGWLTGSVIARPLSGSARMTVDFIWHPDYAMQASAMAAETIAGIERAGNPCQMLIADQDEWKRQKAAGFGFQRVSRTGIMFEMNGQRVPLDRYERRKS